MPSPASTAKGRPQQSHIGPSRNVILLQQGAQKPWPCPKGSRHAIQSGGNKKSASRLFQFSAIAPNLAAMSSERPHLFDFRAVRAARLRAARIDGDRVLDQSALEGLVHRLESVTRRFGRGLWVGGDLPEGIRSFAQEWVGADFDDQEFLKADGPFDLA